MTSFDPLRKIRKLLDVDIPIEASGFHYHEFQPGDDLAYRVAYVKFKLSKAGYVDLMARLGAETHDANPTNPYLPVAWSTEPGLNIDWWDPKLETPRGAAARPYGVNGWLAAKHESESIYLIARDTSRGPWK